jgi:hypothetical protein
MSGESPKIEMRDVEKLLRILNRSQKRLFNVTIDHLVVQLMLLEIIEREVFGEDPDLGKRMAKASQVVEAWRKEEKDE